MASSETATTDYSATVSGDDSSSDGEDVDVKNSGESPPSSDSLPYSVGEKVLAYHGQQIYKAKVLKIESQMEEWRYFVHYMGWSKKWDEWVGTDRLMKFTEENVHKRQVLKSEQGAARNAKPRHSPPIKSFMRRKKQKSNSFIKEKGSGSMEKRIYMYIPSTLKSQLVEDHEFITRLGKLVKLPRSPTVDDILKRYLDYRSKKDGMIDDSVGEIINGLRLYFDKALPAMLLYNSERQQYQEAIVDGVSPSTIYGAEHLLRLFVKLPEILYRANIEEVIWPDLQQQLKDFIKFLQRNQNSFFSTTYQTAGVSDPTMRKQDD